ncbi:hypothetical protein QBC46DRAFT_367969 [Diplogelasinospora grovesii]|uniref:DUF7703 domain-containing protein n=1 Tax=Diplogelasinospora grovesii TaxID=303347 RepID=A0AAN6MXL5_9PEZI|nr:hypothetical protein QBC46DRAFT_367969 [Diplogelasinospora grovesii]
MERTNKSINKEHEDTFLTTAFYNALELNVLVFTTFKSLGYLFTDFALISSRVPVCILVPIGWCAMVTGQSMVLHSRLHLLLYNDTILRAVLAIIIVDAVLLPYSIYEKVEVYIFFVQELVISTIYLVCTICLSRDLSTRRLLHHLFAINAAVITMDVSILVLEFFRLYAIQTAWKGLIYSVKLKLEFRVLTVMVCLARTGQKSKAPQPPRRKPFLDILQRCAFNRVHRLLSARS